MLVYRLDFQISRLSYLCNVGREWFALVLIRKGTSEFNHEFSQFPFDDEKRQYSWQNRVNGLLVGKPLKLVLVLWKAFRRWSVIHVATEMFSYPFCEASICGDYLKMGHVLVGLLFRRYNSNAPFSIYYSSKIG